MTTDPKGAREGVWEPHLRQYLPHIGRVGGNEDFSNLADVVIIDEAHHFRNPRRRGDADANIEPSRYYRLYELHDNSERPKTLFMLNATPINNRLSDFRHMAELFTRRNEDYFGRTVEISHKPCDESTSGDIRGQKLRNDGGTSADPVLAMHPADLYRDCASRWSWANYQIRMGIERHGEPQGSSRWHNQTFGSASRMTPAQEGLAA